MDPARPEDKLFPSTTMHTEPSTHDTNDIYHANTLSGTPPKIDADIGTAVVFKTNSSTSSTDQTKLAASGRAWKTTLIRHGPLTGIGCMVLAATSIAIALGILLGSHGAPVASWSVEPSAVLAICTAVANQSLRFAAFQGFVVAWWFNASRGTTIRKLHVNWRAGTTFGGALLAGREMGLIGLACILSTLVAVDGPLLQKAATVRNALYIDRVQLTLAMAPEVPKSYTGGWFDGIRTMYTFNDTVPTAGGHVSNNVSVVSRLDRDSLWNKPWFNDIIPPGVIHGCPGLCKAKVRAPALAQTECTTREIPVNYTIPVNLTNILSPTGIAAPLSQNSFFISPGIILDEREKVNLVTAFAKTEDCAGVLYMTMCTLESAIGEYEVTVDHEQDQITLGDAPPTIIAIANNTKVDHTWDNVISSYPSTLGGIVTSAQNRFESWVMWFVSQGQVHGNMIGNTPNKFLLVQNNTEEKCHSYVDPKDTIIQYLNKLMFTVGAVAAHENPSYLESHLDPGLSSNTTKTIPGHIHGSHNIFHTNLRWFAAAAAVEAFCIALILPTYVGFWRLGRPVSFSPLEVAKAFEAPLLAECNSNSSGKDISKAMSDTQVQYGATQALLGPTKVTKLSFASPNFVRYPEEGSRFDV